MNCPGRFAIKTEPIPPDLEPVKKKQLADAQAEVIVDYCTEIHEQSRGDLVRMFELLINESKNQKDLAASNALREMIFSEIKNACYPYIYVSTADIRTALEAQQKEWIASPLMLAPCDRMSTIAEPGMLRAYYVEQCRELLANGYLLEAGLSVVPMPVTYAIERSKLPHVVARKGVFEALQTFFPVPRLSDIDDSVVDGRYRWSDQTTIVNQEYTLLNSLFWADYEQHLRSPQWRDLAHSKDAPSKLVRERLYGSRDRAIASKRVVAFDDVQNSIVARRREQTTNARAQSSPQSSHPPKPLSYFDALRTHFALSRLSYYTGTDPEYFQKNVLFVNYGEYAKQFILMALVEINKGGPGPGNKLVVPTSNQPGQKSGRVLGYAEVVNLFGGTAAGPNTVAVHRLGLVDELIKNRVVPEELDPTDPKRIAYHECLERAATLLQASDAQMPACHYIAAARSDDRPRESGKDEAAYRKEIFESTQLPSITMVNIGVGASNAKAITDHLAPLRPRCWMLVGRCSGLRKQQHVGDYAFATSYVRRDGVLDRAVPRDAPIQTTRVMVEAFEKAIAHLSLVDQESAKRVDRQETFDKVMRRLFISREGLTPEQEEARFHARRRIVRLGTVISTNDRNWETVPIEELLEDFNTYRAIAVDMEGAAIAANGYRYRVHHASFLCVSAKPLHGSVKIRQLQDSFYVRQSGRHLEIAIGAIRWLEYNFESALLLQYSRELRGSDDPPWN
jgi:nucleoside phosphorylase